MQLENIKDFITYICNTVGPRPCGSKEEREAANLIKDYLSSSCDSVVLQNFFAKPRILQHLITVLVVIYTLALISFYIYPFVTILLLFVLLLIAYFTRCKSLPVLEFLFPSVPSQNVIGKINATKKADTTLIFSAHHDSAYVMPFFGLNRPFSLFIYALIIFLIFFLLILAASKYFLFATQLSWGTDVVNYLTVTAWEYDSLLPAPYKDIINYSSIGCIVTYPVCASLNNLLVTNTPTLGANDNLSGVSVVLALAKYLSKERPQNTDVHFISFGAEEPGTTGSKVFVKEYIKNGKDKAKQTKVINLECLGDGILCVAQHEVVVSAKHCSRIINLVKKTAKEENIKLRGVKVIGGSTDAAPFTWYKISACTILRLDKWGVPVPYHTLKDIPDAIYEDELQEAFKLCVSIVKNVDKGKYCTPSDDNK